MLTATKVQPSLAGKIVRFFNLYLYKVLKMIYPSSGVFFLSFQNATLGALALSFSSSMEKFSKQIRKLIMSQISHQMKSTSKLEIAYLEGSFSGLNDLLVVFPFEFPRESHQLENLRDTLIKCSEYPTESERRIHRRGALLIFARHCKTLFGPRLIELSECKHW